MLIAALIAVATAAGLGAAAVARTQADPTITVITGGDRETAANATTTTNPTGGEVAGVEGVKYQLLQGGNVLDTCTSDEDGRCVFENVTPGQYTVRQQSAPEGWFLNPTLGVGAAATPSTSVATPYNDIPVSVAAGATNVTVPAGPAFGQANNTATRSGTWAVSRTNPPAPTGCTNSVALIFDLSASISDTDLAIYKTAAEGFVRALEGVNVNVQLFTFGDGAGTPGNPAANFPPVSTTDQDGVDSLVRQIQGIDLPSGQFTNWDAGLFQVAQSSTQFAEAIMMTDGDPTAFAPNGGGAVIPATTTFQRVENGIFAANALKHKGTRIIGVGLDTGSSGSIANLKAISGPDQDKDYFSLPFSEDQFTSLLKNLALQHCAELTLDKSVQEESFQAGDTIHYTYRVTNTGPEDGFPLHNITVSDDRVTGTISNCVHEATGEPITAENPLRHGQVAICTATTQATQADVDAGEIVNTAHANGTTPNGDNVMSNEDEAKVVSERDANISITKKGSPNPFTELGQTITYTYVVTNTGNVTLREVSVTDPSVENITCEGQDNGAITLAPGDSITCTATHQVTQDDLNAGRIENTATATGTPPPGIEPPSDEATEIVTSEGEPAIEVTKTAEPTTYSEVGQVITYTYEVTNTGPVTLTDVSLMDSAIPGPFDCEPAEPATLDPGESMRCTATHTITQADLDAGNIHNTVTAIGTPPEGEPVTDEAEAEVSGMVTENVEIVKTADPTTYTEVGQVIHYTFVVTNNGNVTEREIVVTDSNIGTISCPQSELAPGEQMTCTASHTITQTDLDEGSVPNAVAAKGTPPPGPAGEVESLPDDVVVTEIIPEVPVTG